MRKLIAPDALTVSGAIANMDSTPIEEEKKMNANLSKLTGRALRDAEWVLSFEEGTTWVTGAFRPNREQQLIKAGVLIPTDKEGEFKVGKI